MGFQRDIVDFDYYRTSSHPNYAADSCIVTLECGHTKRYKGSQVPRKRAACPDCKATYDRFAPLIRAWEDSMK